MTQDELKEILKNNFIGQIDSKESRLRIVELLKQYVHDCRIVEEDPDLKALKKELGIKDDPNVFDMEIQLNLSVNTVTIDLTV